MLQRVVRSTVIDAPIERVWAVLRDFNSHDRWHDVVAESRIEGGERSDQVGCVRSFTLQDGHRIREQLLTLDDREYRSTYTIVEATVPLQRYVATVTLRPVTDAGATFWHWESTFDTPPGRERELRDMVAQGVYEAGFANLRRHLAGAADLRGGAAPMPVALPLAARRVVVAAYGGADVLRGEAFDAPPPGPGEVRVRQRAIGVNYLDVYLRRGFIPAMLPLPGVPGMEAAGSVIDVGPGVHGVSAGDRVAYLGPRAGAYASVRNVPADWLLRLPAAVDDDSAAATLLKGVTADYLLRDLGRIGRGTRLLVHAAAGGVGLLLCAGAARLGARVIGTVSTDEKARLARAQGCDEVIVTRDYRFADAVQRLAGGADVIVDGLGDAARDENLAALAARGHWISLGQASGALQALDPDALLAKSASFSRPVVFAYMATREERQARAQRVWDALADGTLGRPLIERHALDAAAQAHRRLEQRATAGALVLVA
ncbi:MAG: SRPBCC family protein [Proteobacteria bacterium]|nr:SRPBCC family protein [Pseudomonadota bacterium]